MNVRGGQNDGRDSRRLVPRGRHIHLLRVGKNAIARLSAQVGARWLSLALVALVARYGGASVLGRYALTLTIVGIVGVLTDAGLNTLLIRSGARSTDESQRELLAATLPAKTILALLGYVALALLAWLAPLEEEMRWWLWISGLTLLPDALAGAMSALINARQRMEISGLLNLTARGLTLMGSVCALMLGWGVPGVLACTVGAGVVSVAAHLAVLWKWDLLRLWQWSPGRWRGYLAESYPFALTSLIAAAYMRVDLLLIGWWWGDAAAGWYSAAYRLWEAVGRIPASVLDALFPEMSRLSVAPDGMSRLRCLFRRAGPMMLGVGLMLAVAGTIGAEPLIQLVYGGRGDYAASVPVFRLLVWAIPAMFLYLLGGHTLYALGRQQEVTRWMGLVGAMNIALNVLLIPHCGYLGAAGVALLSETLLAGLLYVGASQVMRETNT